MHAVRRLRLFGSALREDWNPVGMNAFDQFMGLLLDLEAVLGRKVDAVDWNAEGSEKDLYAA